MRAAITVAASDAPSPAASAARALAYKSTAAPYAERAAASSPSRAAASAVSNTSSARRNDAECSRAVPRRMVRLTVFTTGACTHARRLHLWLMTGTLSPARQPTLRRFEVAHHQCLGLRDGATEALAAHSRTQARDQPRGIGQVTLATASSGVQVLAAAPPQAWAAVARRAPTARKHKTLLDGCGTRPRPCPVPQPRRTV